MMLKMGIWTVQAVEVKQANEGFYRVFSSLVILGGRIGLCMKQSGKKKIIGRLDGILGGWTFYHGAPIKCGI